MKRNLLKTVIILLAVTFVISCNKENNFKVETNDLVNFQNVEEFNQELKKVISLSLDELIAYEDSKGYKSFGRTCDEIYESIDFEKFNSFKELETYINFKRIKNDNK